MPVISCTSLNTQHGREDRLPSLMAWVMLLLTASTSACLLQMTSDHVGYRTLQEHHK